MAVGKEMNPGFGAAIFGELARLRIDHGHRIGEEKRVRPFGWRGEVKRHRRTIGQAPVLVSRIVRRDDRRRDREQVEQQQAECREAHRPRRQPPLATKAGERATVIRRRRHLQWNSKLRRRAHWESIEEKSTRGSTMISAISASRLPSSNSTAPISTEPITR